jgi:hypothetical protein
MKLVKLIISAAMLLALMGSCKQQLCPGYGELNNEAQQTEERA